MAILKQKLNRKNESGSYDEIHLKTDASNVSMSTTDETLLSTKISSMDTAIAGKQPAGSYAAADHNHNGVYQPAGSYAAANHNHSGVYQPVGSYATTAQLNEVKTSVSNGKSLIASAITDKGVSTASSATFQTMANNIRSINSIAAINLNSVDGKLFDYGVATVPVIDKGSNTIYTAGTSLSADRGYIIYNINGSGYSKVYMSANTNNHTLRMYMSRIVFRNGLLFFESVFSDQVGIGGTRNLGFTMTNNDIYTIEFSFDYINSRIRFS